MKAELAGKEARLSDRSMAQLLLHCTSQLPKPNRGWVLEGWPKTLAQARAAFSDDKVDVVAAVSIPVAAQVATLAPCLQLLLF